MEDLAVVVMAKLPEPGRVKTRLLPDLSAEQAAGVQRVFLAHLVRRLARIRLGRLIVCHDPPDRREAMRDVTGGDGIHFLPQSGGDLGARLAAAARVAAGRDHGSAVLFLGVDAPDVPEALLRRVAALLASHDLALGPADDGGYWTLALRPRVDAGRLLGDIEWSSGREFDQTVAAAGRLGYNVGLADRWQDVDRPADLRRLVGRLRGSPDADDRELLARLAEVLPAPLAPPTRPPGAES
jgi:rSAM/selenodomain-associated transferase 1